MNEGTYVLFGMIGWMACIGLGCYVAGEKGREPGEGFVLALLFGPFGVLISALLPTKTAAIPTPAVLPSPKTMAYMPKVKPAAKPDPPATPVPPPLPPKEPRHVTGDDGIVRWTCICGNSRTAQAAMHGKLDVCPRCHQKGIVPGNGVPSAPPPPAPKPRAADPPPSPTPFAPPARASFEDEDGINDAKTLDFLSALEQPKPPVKKRRS